MTDDLAGPGATTGSIAAGWSLTIRTGTVQTNAANITVPGTGSGPAAGSPYPSSITVAGFPLSYITRLKVRMNTFTHTWPEDVGLLLVGPAGQRVRLMVDSGGPTTTFSGELIFDSTALKVVPDAAAPVASTYLPSTGNDTAAGGSDPHPANFLGSAPAGPYGTDLAVFNSTQPNGTWSLYADDDTNGDSGIIAGWSLIMDLVTATSAPVDLGGRVITQSGQGIKGVAVTVEGGGLKQPITVMTTSFGRYNFSGLPSGQTYIVSVRAKRYIFADPVRIIDLSDSISDLEFVASQ